MAVKLVKDKNVLETIVKLLQKRTASTKVDKNKEIRMENQLAKQQKQNDVRQLRDALKAKLQE